MIEPTAAQLKVYWRMSISPSNLFESIDLVRLDERNDRIVMIVEDKIRFRDLAEWRGNYSIMNLDYSVMSDSDLLAYVKHHPQDNEAFHAYVDRKRAAFMNVTPMTPEQAEIELHL